MLNMFMNKFYEVCGKAEFDLYDQSGTFLTQLSLEDCMTEPQPRDIASPVKSTDLISVSLNPPLFMSANTTYPSFASFNNATLTSQREICALKPEAIILLFAGLEMIRLAPAAASGLKKRFNTFKETVSAYINPPALDASQEGGKRQKKAHA